ncbi:MAG: HlyD family secretion protein [Chthoniobacterales bacterium]
MKRDFRRYLVTFAVVAAAVAVSLLLYHRYTTQPWTRDAQVRANIVGIAPRVAGPVVNLPIKDNEAVAKGDLLFEIDPATFQAAVDSAKAGVDEAAASLKKADQELERQKKLFASEVNDVQAYQNAQDSAGAAQASLDAAKAELIDANLQLGYTKVVAPVDGYLTNVSASPGTYVGEGDQLLALVDRESFWIAAYFKETQLEHVTEGGKVRVILLGHESDPFEGEIESVGWGVFREDGSTASDMLPTVSETIDWVRLPQRFPVRIRVVGEPPVPLRIGQTASVVISK